jgi:hypothetical protein
MVYSESKGAPHDTGPAEGFVDELRRSGPQDAVGMEEQEDITARVPGTFVHLRSPARAALDHTSSPLGGDFAGFVATQPIHDDDLGFFGKGRECAPEIGLFVECWDDDG